MIQDIFCDIYSSITDRYSALKKLRFYSLLRWITRRTANIILPVYFRHHPTGRQFKSTGSQHIIVSLTTFPARVNKVWIVIECLLRQTVCADSIILWLSKEQFRSINQLPKRLIELQARGLEIRLVDEDLRSHKKYLYAIRQYPEDLLITVDDDLIYRSTLIEELITVHHAHPQAVIAHYTHDMRYDEHGSLLPYNEWSNNVTEGAHLFFGSGGGTLFPPYALYKDVMDSDTAMRLCPNADDVWLNAMTRMQHTAIVHAGRKEIYLPVLQSSNKMALFASNENGGNDRQIQQLTDYCTRQYQTNPFDRR